MSAVEHMSEQSHPQQETLRVARDYAALGWHVVPVRPGEKMPAVLWADYSTRAATADEITNWFSVGGYGVGLVQGATARTIVLDFDGDDGLDTLRAIEREHGELPLSPRQITPGGGIHYVFRHPGRYVPTRKGILPGFDVRGDGGFIVAHPSRHPNGRHYAWDVDAHYEDVDVADCPEWVAELICGEAPATNDEAVVYAARKGGLGLAEAVIVDGREQYMRGTVLAVYRELWGELGRRPDADQLFERAWPQYARKVDFSRPGRGADEMRAKCAYTVARGLAGRLPVKEPDPKDEARSHSEEPKEQHAPDDDIFPTYDLDALLALPPVEWMVEGLFTTEGFSVVYGPPASLKTFAALDWALCIANGVDWKGRKVTEQGVLYVAGEGVRGIARRVRAWQRENGLEGVDMPFRLLAASVNLTDPEQVQKLIRTAVAQSGIKVGLVIIDTVARSIPGADENSAQDMGRFVTAIEAIRAGLTCHVQGVHHSGKDTERGARGSSALLGAVDTMVQVKRDGEAVTLTIEKQKDDDEGRPIKLVTKKVEWLEGLQPWSSLVLVEDDEAKPEPRDNRADWREIARALGENGKMTTNAIRAALMWGGSRVQEACASLPFYPDYVTIDLGPDLTVRLQRNRQGTGATSPVNVLRSDPK